MIVIRSIKEWQTIRENIQGSIGFVPTMGALHNAHLSLVKRAKAENQTAVVSIFVNPTQFNDPKDFERYPNTINQDLEQLESIGTDYVLLPTYQELYQDNYKYVLSETCESKYLCGASRPGHFDGVLTVVMKLLNIVSATHAYFGEKDFQQLHLIKGMAVAFFLKTKIIGCPILRESDGLAMSSRNMLLTEADRALAPKFNQELSQNKSTQEIIKNLEQHGFRVDYITEKWNRRFGAVFLGNVRLIDNVELK